MTSFFIRFHNGFIFCGIVIPVIRRGFWVFIRKWIFIFLHGTLFFFSIHSTINFTLRTNHTSFIYCCIKRKYYHGDVVNSSTRCHLWMAIVQLNLNFGSSRFNPCIYLYVSYAKILFVFAFKISNEKSRTRYDTIYEFWYSMYVAWKATENISVSLLHVC